MVSGYYKNSIIVVVATIVKNPTKLRFAWQNNAQSALFNGAHLPALSFVTE